MMDKRFGTWYRKYSIFCDDTLLRNRWAGVDDFLKEKISLNDVVDLVRVFFGRKPSSNNVEKRISDCMIEHDSAAYIAESGQEMGVLTGAILSQLLHVNISKVRVLIWLSMKSMSFIYKSAAISEVYDEAMQNFADARAEKREDYICKVAKPVKLPSTGLLNKSLEKEFSEFNESDKQGVKTFLSTLTNTITNLRDNQNDLLTGMNIFREDSQILWWILARKNGILQEPYAGSNAYKAALYAGLELASFIQEFPGPYSAYAVLAEVLSVCTSAQDEVQLLRVIRDSCEDWKKHNEESKGLGSATPIHSLLKYCGETNDLCSDIATELDVANDMCVNVAANLAYQVYIEKMILNIMDEVDTNE